MYTHIQGLHSIIITRLGLFETLDMTIRTHYQLITVIIDSKLPVPTAYTTLCATQLEAIHRIVADISVKYIDHICNHPLTFDSPFDKKFMTVQIKFLASMEDSYGHLLVAIGNNKNGCAFLADC